MNDFVDAITSIAGREAMMNVARKHGGSRIYISRFYNNTERWNRHMNNIAKITGEENAQKIVKLFSSCRCYIPDEYTIGRRLKKK